MARVMFSRAERLQDRERGIDQQDIFHDVVFFLAAITIGLFSRVLGAHDAPLGAVMGKRGEASLAASVEEMGSTGGGTSSSDSNRLMASAGETPSRWARAERERAGVSPRVRRATCRAGNRT